VTYSIGEVAARTGLKPVTLRAWENRYHLVRPTRTQSSYRQYTDADVALLLRMSSLIASGVPARRAATLARQGGGDPVDTQGLVGLDDHDAITRAASRLDRDAVRRLLDEAFALASPETVIDSWLMPSMRNVGDAWADGTLDVASEHFISAAVMRKLAAIFEAVPPHGPRVVVGLPAAATHELPALAFSILLQRAGADVLYVGADVPTDSWTRVVHTWRPRAAVLGVLTADDVQTANAAIAAVRSAGVALVYVGGRASDRVTHGITLPAPLSDAARLVASTLESSPA